MVRRSGGRSQSRFDHPPEEELLRADEAAALLGVKRATLYTYVSRGLIRCVPEKGTKENRYLRADVDRLKTRHDARAGHAAVASGALRWGEPVIDSSVSRIGEEGLQYRGHDAVALATGGHRFEDVAELLWTGHLPSVSTRWPLSEPSPTGSQPKELSLLSPAALAALLPRGTPPVSALAALVPLLAASDEGRFAAPTEQEQARARRLIRHLGAWVCVAQAPGRVSRALKTDTVAESLATAWDTKVKRAPELINRALILCADHELNTSTFAARVTASAGADLYACMSAALAAVSGHKHGGACDRVEALLTEVGRPERAAQVIHGRLRRGEAVTGFGHRLYTHGDPRTPPLVEAALSVRPESLRVRIARAVIDTMRDAGHPPPSMDIGLVMLADALGLPPGAGTVLFSLGRTAGWVAHILEQREQGHLLRPRARYVETPPKPA
ncbi:helix-turn-helix domain-containing protein [Corallococcus praedator]|uniref:citrate synthase (unknown stereospecificity) n=1 Tax=Corallococcus praedator TaxID=2316724 RepID=A0ABX9Q7D3_9BACT|nr:MULTISPECIES: citrate synthase family protein [Corallococcus]RKH04930.1 helix-turn-helix domain-containing protein [Corallococcus sp. CA047B]RKH21467.1 helix-turn-helix domain-containing protein [Corallococcus sp. CA031C]RKH93440.1 helix-turn-helix domain-containing protein [Corallococcus praedator]